MVAPAANVDGQAIAPALSSVTDTFDSATLPVFETMYVQVTVDLGKQRGSLHDPVDNPGDRGRSLTGELIGECFHGGVDVRGLERRHHQAGGPLGSINEHLSDDRVEVPHRGLVRCRTFTSGIRAGHPRAHVDARAWTHPDGRRT